jgi:hypothetical protein
VTQEYLRYRDAARPSNGKEVEWSDLRYTKRRSPISDRPLLGSLDHETFGLRTELRPSTTHVTKYGENATDLSILGEKRGRRGGANDPCGATPFSTQVTPRHA